MSTPDGQPSNVARDASQIGVLGNNADVDTIIFGGVQLTAGPDALPEDTYRAGVNNLRSGNPPEARTLIWKAMMRDYAHSEVVFHWLIAMLSGRAMKQFSAPEKAQLNSARSRFAQTGSGPWADGIRLIYRLLDAVPLAGPDQVRPGQPADTTSMQALVGQFDRLQRQQREMIRPHLELFLTGPLQNEKWQEAVELAQSQQHSGDRLGRAWMFFHPDPAKVNLRPPEPEQITGAHRLGLRASAWGLAVVSIYLCVELLLHGAVVGFLAVLVALGAGIIAATADLELRFLAERRRLNDQQAQAAAQSASSSPAGETVAAVRKLYQRYSGIYVQDRGERERWETATTSIRQCQEDELVHLCRVNGFAPAEVAWLIRFQLRELKRAWQKGSLHEYRQEPAPEPGTAGKRAVALVVLVVGGAVALFELRTHPLADSAGLLCSYWLWHCWLRVNCECRRYAADRKAHDQRQAALDKEYARWSQKLKDRPADAEMASWLDKDRTVLLGQLLDHYRLDRSDLKARTLLERNGVAARKAQLEGGPWRYQGYRFRVLLLAGDGVREIRADLDFLTGTLTMRERTSYAYTSIVSAHVKRDRHTQVFTFTLTAGNPVTFRVPDVTPAQIQQDQDTGPAENTGDTDETPEETAPDVTSVADVLHRLEQVTAEGRTTLRHGCQPGAATHSS